MNVKDMGYWKPKNLNNKNIMQEDNTADIMQIIFVYLYIKSSFRDKKYLSHSSADLCNCLPLNINDNIMHTNATPLAIKTFASTITASNNNFIIKIHLLVS